MPGIFRVGFIFALVVVFMLPRQAEAFNRDLAQSIVIDAIAFCPDNLKSYLENRQKLVMDGLKYGSLNPEPIDTSASVRISDTLSKRISQGRQNEFNVITSFGTLAFFLSETISPGLCRTVHPLLPEVVTYDGPDSINDTLSRVKSLMEESRPFHGSCEPETVGQAYNLAVNTIVDFWVSACIKGGLDTGPALDAGSQINHTQNAVYTPEELTDIKAAEQAEAAALSKRMAELLDLAKKGVKSEELDGWVEEIENKNEVDHWINKYNLDLAYLEKLIDDLRLKKLMDSNDRDKLNDLKARASEVERRLFVFENDPKAALKMEKNKAW